MLATETDRALALSIRGRSRKIFLASDHCGNEKKTLRGDANTALAVVRRSQKFSPSCRPPSRGSGTAKI